MDVSEIISELNDHGFTDTGTNRKVSMIQQTIWEVEGREPWPWCEEIVALDYDGSSAVATNMPTDFRTLLWIKDTSTGLSLTFLRQEEAEAKIGTEYTQSGDPRYYYFEANELKVWPVPPASADRLRMHYLKWSPEITDATLEADILLPTQHHRLLVWGTLWKLYDMEDDPELAARYQQHFENGLVALRASMWQRQLGQVESILQVDDDYGC